MELKAQPHTPLRSLIFAILRDFRVDTIEDGIRASRSAQDFEEAHTMYSILSC
jgi:hypothetical protein